MKQSLDKPLDSLIIFLLMMFILMIFILMIFIWK